MLDERAVLGRDLVGPEAQLRSGGGGTGRRDREEREADRRTLVPCVLEVTPGLLGRAERSGEVFPQGDPEEITVERGRGLEIADEERDADQPTLFHGSRH